MGIEISLISYKGKGYKIVEFFNMGGGSARSDFPLKTNKKKTRLSCFGVKAHCAVFDAISLFAFAEAQVFLSFLHLSQFFSYFFS